MNIRVIILFLLFLFCSAKTVFSQNIIWDIRDGWVVKKISQDLPFEKHFAIGMWGIPGYKFNKASHKAEQNQFSENIKIYSKNMVHVNSLYVQSSFEKNYMRNLTWVIGTSELSSFFKKNYLKEQKDASYYMMQKMKKDVNTVFFDSGLTNYIKTILNKINNPTKNFIWAPIDEVASGFQSWYWPISVTEKTYSIIKKQTPNNLVFIDLGGSAGSSFFFDKYYMEKHKSVLHKTPPYGMLSNKKTGYLDLEDFRYDYSGNSIFEYPKGKRARKKYDDISIKKFWYENTKEIASAYKKSGDIFGTNAFSYFYQYPQLAGVTVNAIKAGTGNNSPVWLFFDGNGYAKPQRVSIDSYLKNIKCQIYISIIHGATGVFFWNDPKKGTVFFEKLRPIIDELKRNEIVFKYQSIEKKLDENIQYEIKQSSTGERYLIVINSNKNKKISISYPIKRNLDPLEVYITKLN